MCIYFLPLSEIKSGLTFGDLTDVQTVGIGLYLALVVLQAISATGIAGLARRVATLRSGVTGSRLGAIEAGNIRRLSGELSGLEIGFHNLNRRALKLVISLFFISIFYFSYCVIWQDFDAGVIGVWFIFLFYIGLPVTIFLILSLIIDRQCAKVEQKISEAEKRIRNLLLGLN